MASIFVSKTSKSMDDVNRGIKKELIVSDVYARQGMMDGTIPLNFNNWSFYKQFARVSIHSSTKLFEISISRRSNVIIRLFQSKMESAHESRLYYQFLYRERMMGSTNCTCLVEMSSAFLDPWQTSKNFENFGFYFIQFWPRRLWISLM